MKLLYKFVLKNLKQNRKRTMVSIIGITLSCSLLFCVGLFASTYRDNALRETIRYYGSHHIEYNNINKEKIDLIKNEATVDKVILKKIVQIGTLFIGGHNQVANIISIDSDYNNMFSKINGRLPKNEKEVLISHSLARLNNLNVNDILEITNENESYSYTIVGVYFLDDSSSSLGYSYTSGPVEKVYTYFSVTKNDKLNAFVTLKSTKDGLLKLENLTKKLDIPFSKLGITDSNEYFKTNTDLLFLYGEMYNAGTYAIISLSVMLISTVLSVVCILIIYNSFAISVTERKRQLGVLSSIGATPSQIKKSVFIEAGIISLIAIPISFILSILNVSFTLFILNKLLETVIIEPLRLSIYPNFMMISLIFVIISIFLSALFPAARASEITPIEAIKLNKDIKIKGKKIKSNRLISKLFGIEGEIAFKNVKRNKKRFRTTTISLTISIILFLVTATYINAIFDNSFGDYYDNDYNYDATITIPEGNDQKEIINKIKKVSEVKDYVQYKQQFLSIEKTDDKYFDSSFLELLLRGNEVGKKRVVVVSLEDNIYQRYMKKLGLDLYQPIILNSIRLSFYKGASYEKETFEGQIYNENKKLYINFCNYSDDRLDNINNCYYKMDNFHYTKTSPSKVGNFQTFIIVNESIYEMLRINNETINSSNYGNNITIQLKLKNPQKFDEQMINIIQEYPATVIDYLNVKYENQQSYFSLLAFLFAIYSFIAFITLIAVTSVINSINTNINLRKIEFAMLKSVGQNQKSFNKMISLESIFLGIKSLVYGLIISFGLIYVIIKIGTLGYDESKIEINIPTDAIIICAITVFFIIFLAMFYATNKTKKENIIDTIRKENI